MNELNAYISVLNDTWVNGRARRKMNHSIEIWGDNEDTEARLVRSAERNTHEIHTRKPLDRRLNK